MKKQIIIMLVILLQAMFPSAAQKKVYADYHGVHKTRAVDGDLGEWKYASALTNNPVATQVTHNADLIIDGKNQIAAVHYPLTGMQSQLDPDYLEYQILSAKAAGIDGFFIEWGYMDHGAHNLLTSILPVAKKYNFEVGVILCPWLMSQNWITAVRPDISSREQKVDYFKGCMQWLIDSVFSVSTCPVVNGRPVIYFFGDGFTPDEMKQIQDYPYTYPDGYPTTWKNKFPQVIVRTLLAPTLVNGVYTPKSPVTQAAKWNANGFIPTPWMPERIRSGAGTAYSNYNYYATADDCDLFIRKFATDIWQQNSGFASGFVAPGMDNYGCGGWSATGKLFLIPRNEGQTYRKMWETNLEYKNFLDMVYIASWSDFTEGHEIEPTIENSDRELRATLQYASQFKNKESYNESGIAMPLALFELRKKLELCRKTGLSVNALHAGLEETAEEIANGNYQHAQQLLATATASVNALRAQVSEQSFTVDASQISMTGNKHADGYYILSSARTGLTINNSALKQLLANHYYEGYMHLEYYDGSTWGPYLQIISGTDRQPADLFKLIAVIKDAGINQWISGKVAIIKENVKFGGQANNSDIAFYSNGTQAKIKNISFTFKVFTAQSSGISTLNTDPFRLYLSNKSLIIDSPEKTPAVVELLSRDGIVLRQQRMNHHLSMDISPYPKGMYLLRLNTGKSFVVKKIII